MIDFNDEIKKYEPILEVGNIEESIHSTDLKDIMDMLSYISKNKEEANRIPNEFRAKGKWD